MDTGLIHIYTGTGKGKTTAAENVELLVLDEILISVLDNFLDEDELLSFIKDKPGNLELVLTGRGATERITRLADYVSDINCIAHPYNKGVESRKGIEF